ncbi:hypothetical protein [Alicyclobacillus macrosporangiidus]|uniref:Uncharacterized protein n=1 Tax=Alicyclobacillus macrosporangiidus TaxID=392015 RepID=A0A1I7L2S3_9BACL|nr:hypothetical protein [Alicyclobacillus macrosporangiidus]SFV03928.1 hypothetical protein SAMN05421543_12361 [Alicyclobacillus macrosporangiidus]
MTVERRSSDLFIEGRYITNEGYDAEYGRFSVAQIRSWLENGHVGMLHVSEYVINGTRYNASALMISKDHGIPSVRDGKLVIPAWFRRKFLGPPHRDHGDPDDLVQVEVLVDPSDPHFFVSIVEASA